MPLEQAQRLLTRGSQSGLDPTQEKPATRQRYGNSLIGTSCLLARRLVEAGSACHRRRYRWDMHQQIFGSYPIPDSLAAASCLH